MKSFCPSETDSSRFDLADSLHRSFTCKRGSTWSFDGTGNLGLDVGSRDLNAYRDYFAQMSIQEYVDKVLMLPVKTVVMTNDPFDPMEKPFWDTTGNSDRRFRAALRIDPLLNDYQIHTGNCKIGVMMFQSI